LMLIFLDKALPEVPWESQTPAKYALTNLMRILVQEAKGHPLKRGDGRDFFHAVIGAAYGSFAALDKHWKRRVETLRKPNGLAKIYYAPELEMLVDNFERHVQSLPQTQNTSNHQR